MPEFIRKGPIQDWIYEYDEETGEFTETGDKQNVIFVEAAGTDGNVHTVSASYSIDTAPEMVEMLFLGAENSLRHYMISGKVWND